MNAKVNKCFTVSKQKFKTAANGNPFSHPTDHKSVGHSASAVGVLLFDCLKVSRTGFIKFHRVIQDHPVKKDHSCFILFFDLLADAEWTDGAQVFFKGKQITLKRGQLVRGRFQLANSTGLAPSTVRDSLKRLTKSKWDICDIEPDREYTLITIKNYDRYQDNGLPPNIEPNTNPTPTRHQPDTIEEVKNLRIKEKTKNMVFDFESLWNKYPNPVGKKEALRHFKNSVTNDKDFSEIQTALENYRRSEKVIKGFIQNGSTWFNNWRDWVVMPVNHIELREIDKYGKY